LTSVFALIVILSVIGVVRNILNMTPRFTQSKVCSWLLERQGQEMTLALCDTIPRVGSLRLRASHADREAMTRYQALDLGSIPIVSLRIRG